MIKQYVSVNKSQHNFMPCSRQTSAATCWPKFSEGTYTSIFILIQNDSYSFIYLTLTNTVRTIFADICI